MKEDPNDIVREDFGEIKLTYRDVEKLAADWEERAPGSHRSRPRGLRTLQLAIIIIRQLCHKTGEMVK